jgi:hypothetical protein
MIPFLRNTATIRVSVDLLPADLTCAIIHERIFGLNVSILSFTPTLVNTDRHAMESFIDRRV